MKTYFQTSLDPLTREDHTPVDSPISTDRPWEPHVTAIDAADQELARGPSPRVGSTFVSPRQLSGFLQTNTSDFC